MPTKKTSKSPAASKSKKKMDDAADIDSTTESRALGKSLVIVESPSKAKTINKYLGKEFTVFASVGHIRELPKKEIGLDFDHHYEPRYDIIVGKEKVVREMKKLAKDASEIFLATDPDREGEAISWHISSVITDDAKVAKKSIRRVLFNEITAKAVREAVSKPRDLDFNLVRSQQARQALDKIVGYKVSPFLWNTVLRGISAGRVQSVALRLVCEREAEITAFKPREYWSIFADFQTPKGEVFSAKLTKIQGKDVELGNEADARKVAEDIRKRLFGVSEIRRKKTRRNPPSPFTTSLLQQAASNQLGFGSKKTMILAQQLYEGIEIGSEGAVGLITYMRTDSKRVGKEAQDEARDFVRSQMGNEFIPENPIAYKSNDAAQDAHEAIRPTAVDRTPRAMQSYLSKDQHRLYELIWKRFVASQMSAAEIEQTSVDIEDVEREFLFRASGNVVLFEGFLKVYGDSKELDYEDRKTTKNEDDEDEKPANLPRVLNEKDTLKLSELKENQHFTKPPSRYSEASLVKELDNFGIGRPSTYASILSTLADRGYVINQNRRLTPTELGKDVNTTLIANFPELFNTDFTAQMETKLDKVAEGKDDYEKLLDNFYLPFSKALELREKSPILPQNDNAETCDKCNKGKMVIKWTKSGKFLSCSRYPKCDNAKSIATIKQAPQESGIKCPKCETGRMVVRIGKFGKFLACTNYPNCDGLLNLDKGGRVTPPKTPPLTTVESCPKCSSPMYLRESKRGLWFSCTRFPKCRGIKSWKDIDEEKQAAYEAEYRAHEKGHPKPELTLIDGTPLDLSMKLEEIIESQGLEAPQETGGQ
ncbi:MAG: type I DNA topoisomerase [Chloroherpetonaceae bacterium]|nr:type I DNA topoisomerase [Chloroherpetonaceae bacterium]